MSHSLAPCFGLAARSRPRDGPISRRLALIVRSMAVMPTDMTLKPSVSPAHHAWCYARSTEREGDGLGVTGMVKMEYRRIAGKVRSPTVAGDLLHSGTVC